MFGRRKKKGWEALTPGQRRGLGIMGLVQVSLLLFALVDWFRRPREQVRGSKLLWLPVLFVNFLGPLSYLKFGRQASVPRA